MTLFLNENLNVMNALDITATDGAHFEVSPAFVALRDATGQSVLLAAVQDSVGHLIAPNVVLYDSAFDSGLDAAIRVSYTRRGIEQDLVLYDPSHQIHPEDFGLIAASTTIELWSEMNTSPQAQVIPVMNDGIVADIVIHFDSTKIAEGKAFSTEREDLAIRVLKRFGDIDGRRWLVEQISYAAAQPLFDNAQAALPGQNKQIKQMAGRKAVKTDKELVAQLPARKKASRTASILPKSKDQLLALAQPMRKGFLIDFQLLNATNLTNMRFQSDSTYEIA
ncbi:MAG: hypothetical protein HYR88_05865 [Verrucomicrobia bacterium]|nr:hypothetical protein [Verrucomicrobiota bacterium]